MRLVDDHEASAWRDVSREVVEARRQLDAAGPDEKDAALEHLTSRIADLEEFHRTDSVHRRRLVAAVAARTGWLPSGAGSQQIDSYVRIIDQASSRLHNDFSFDEAKKLLCDAIEVLTRLFMPPASRDEALSALARIDQPTIVDIDRMLALVITPQHMVAFMRSLTTPAWLQPLHERGRLMPPESNEEVWPFAEGVKSLAETYPAALSEILLDLGKTSRHDAQRLWRVARSALDLGVAGRDVIEHCLRSQPGSEPIQELAVWSCEGGSPCDDFVQVVADLVLSTAAASSPTESYYVDEVVNMLVQGATASNVSDRFQLVCYKLSALTESTLQEVSFRPEGSLRELSDSLVDGHLGALVRATCGLLDRAIEELEVDAVLEMCDRLPHPVSRRARSLVLASAPRATDEQLLEHIRSGIARSSPTGDDVAIIERLEGSDHRRVAFDRIGDTEIGEPPSVRAVGHAIANPPIPEQWLHIYMWSQIIDDKPPRGWDRVVAALEGRFGHRPRDSVRYAAPGQVGFGHSPIPRDVLEQLDVIAATDLISAWRPGPDDWLASALELGRLLQDLVSANPLRWTEDPITVVARLRHPTYIAHYLAGIRHGEPLPPERADQLLETIDFLRSHPYPVVEIGRNEFDYDSGWDGVDEAGVEVIKRLAETSTGLGSSIEAAWDIVLDQLRLTRSAPTRVLGDRIGPLEAAINRAPTRALDAAFSVFAYGYRTEDLIRSEFLDLLTHALRLDNGDGAQYRAIIATRLPLLHRVAPSWIVGESDRLFGLEAPDELGQTTIELALRWSRVEDWLLVDHRDKVFTAVQNEATHALHYAVVAMLRQLDGYSVNDVADHLAIIGRLSSASEIIAHQLKDGIPPNDMIELAVAFWERALTQASTPEDLKGFGWYSEISALAEEHWRTMTLRTLDTTHGSIDWEHQVARRSAREPITESDLDILNLLVRAGTTSWEHGRTLRIAQDVLSSAHDLQRSDAYHRLATAMRERGASPPA